MCLQGFDSQTGDQHENCGCDCECHNTLFGMSVAHVMPCCYEKGFEPQWLDDWSS